MSCAIRLSIICLEGNTTRHTAWRHTIFTKMWTFIIREVSVCGDDDGDDTDGGAGGAC